MMARACPNCGEARFTEFLSPDLIRMETLLRSQFINDRLTAPAAPEQRKDLTDFAHGDTVPVLQCQSCSVLLRAESREPVRTYEDDDYDPAAMQTLLPRYVAAFAAKEVPYRSLLRPGAEILEIGPHLGAFLEIAKRWGWRAVSVDVGKDTSQFVNSLGFVTYQKRLEDCSFPYGYFDGVFIWNCFEQIPDPHSTLTEIRRILQPNGVLVLRTPNALFYRACREYLNRAPDTDLATSIVRTLGYNNLLAWPYLYGYSSIHLDQLAAAHSLSREGGLNSELITLPYPEVDLSMLEQKDLAQATVRGWSELDRCAAAGHLTGPWIETFYRAT
jgi:2-polyprenyl-3-methyl-5-hydroxy-6-metoxy-1,4-benzoquinol methylase